ncbi:hypothetical protein DM860_015548 [Cuscuta australis]|uniref:Uncharacterized protein n=1 Tax=Cuscuta australis TaxID=267555 RepID=A0A328DH92_9ASTE|nr:hypothetical protein DM860_015548 [Cuscuta australis]
MGETPGTVVGINRRAATAPSPPPNLFTVRTQPSAPIYYCPDATAIGPLAGLPPLTERSLEQGERSQEFADAPKRHWRSSGLLFRSHQASSAIVAEGGHSMDERQSGWICPSVVAATRLRRRTSRHRQS